MSDIERIVVNRIAADRLQIPIRGTAPLIVHRFSEKAKKQMLGIQTGEKTPKELRDPQADYEAALYRVKGTDELGFPAIGFKAATVSAARFYGKDVTMTSLRQFLFFAGVQGVDGQMLVVIDGDPTMREDVVRLNRQGTDLRYRPQFTEWSATLDVTFVRAALTKEAVVSLVDAGGLGVGVGEWRPERKGDFGTYEIDPTRDVQLIGDGK